TTDTIGLGNTVHVILQNNTTDNCEAQRSFWKSRLMRCEELIDMVDNNDTLTVDTIINDILDGMVDVCHHSLDQQHPLGASTVKPSYSGQPQSFEQVVNQVFAQHGIYTLPGDHYFCNPFSVDFPKPYGKNPPLMVNNTNVLDSCACKRYALLQAEALQASPGYDTSSITSMNQFLWLNYYDTITAPLWNGLKKCKDMFHDSC